MLSAASLLLLGFVLGMRHATDADHVVAVTAIVSRQCSLRRACAVGAVWGLGHSATILLVGGAIMLFRIAIPPRLGLPMEFAVATMLVVLGALNLSGRGTAPAESVTRPLVVGFVHGLAGSAFVAMLVLAAVPQPLLGMTYLLVFGVGTIGGMMLVTAAIALPSLLTARRFGGAQRYLRFASGITSIAFGVFLAHRVGVVDGLFLGAARWTPR